MLNAFRSAEILFFVIYLAGWMDREMLLPSGISIGDWSPMAVVCLVFSLFALFALFALNAVILRLDSNLITDVAAY